MDDRTKNIFIFLNLFFIVNAYSLFTQAIMTWNTSMFWNILMAVSIFGVGCLGYYAAVYEDRHKLYVYRTIVIVYTTFATITLIMMIFVLSFDKSNYEEAAAEYVLEPMYDSLDKEETRRSIDLMQIGLQCCGLEGPDGDEVIENGTMLMHTCCSTAVIVCTEEEAYSRGCSAPFVDTLRKTWITFTIILAFDIALSVFAIVLATLLAHSIEP